jgi:hypothetical protein
MEMHTEQLSVAFNNRARPVFFALYNTFKQRAVTIDRLKDENVFQQLHSQYLNTLKQQLEQIAKEIIGKSKAPLEQTQFAQRVPALILDFTSEFTQKVRAL